MFSVFDENRSWYIDQNIRQYSTDPSKVDPNDPVFYGSNIIYSKSIAVIPISQHTQQNNVPFCILYCFLSPTVYKAA